MRSPASSWGRADRPDGLVKALTKSVIETALDEEMTEHPCQDKHDRVGRAIGTSRNGTRIKTLLTYNVGPVRTSCRGS